MDCGPDYESFSPSLFIISCILLILVRHWRSCICHTYIPLLTSHSSQLPQPRSTHSAHAIRARPKGARVRVHIRVDVKSMSVRDVPRAPACEACACMGPAQDAAFAPSPPTISHAARAASPSRLERGGGGREGLAEALDHCVVCQAKLEAHRQEGATLRVGRRLAHLPGVRRRWGRRLGRVSGGGGVGGCEECAVAVG